MEKRSKVKPIVFKGIKLAHYYIEYRTSTTWTLLIKHGVGEKVDIVHKDAKRTYFSVENYKNHTAFRVTTQNVDFPYASDMENFCMSLITALIIHKKYSEEELMYCSYLV